ncbi:hypothetical protein Tco_0023542, partial [Tanacetum coccineum]
YAGASLDRKSTTGGCQFLGKRLISWQYKNQTIVANSTTKAKYVAAANCCGQEWEDAHELVKNCDKQVEGMTRPHGMFKKGIMVHSFCRPPTSDQSNKMTAVSYGHVDSSLKALAGQAEGLVDMLLAGYMGTSFLLPHSQVSYIVNLGLLFGGDFLIIALVKNRKRACKNQN